MLNIVQTRNVIPGMCEVLGEDEAPACAIAGRKQRLPVAPPLHSLELMGRGFWHQLAETFVKADVKLGEFHHLVS